MKSGPHLNGCTVKPRLLSAAIKPSVIVVLPTPLEGPAITNAFGVMTDSSCAPRTVRRGVPRGHRIRVCEDVDENYDELVGTVGPIRSSQAYEAGWAPGSSRS